MFFDQTHHRLTYFCFQKLCCFSRSIFYIEIRIVSKKKKNIKKPEKVIFDTINYLNIGKCRLQK